MRLPVSYPTPFRPSRRMEEFLGIKAKKRPVILVHPPDPKLATVRPIRGGAKLVRNLAQSVCCIALSMLRE